MTGDEVFDLRSPYFEACPFFEEHDEFSDRIVAHRDGEGKIVVLRGVDDAANMSNVDSAFES